MTWPVAYGGAVAMKVSKSLSCSCGYTVQRLNVHRAINFERSKHAAVEHMISHRHGMLYEYFNRLPMMFIWVSHGRYKLGKNRSHDIQIMVIYAHRI